MKNSIYVLLFASIFIIGCSGENVQKKSTTYDSSIQKKAGDRAGEELNRELAK